MSTQPDGVAAVIPFKSREPKPAQPTAPASYAALWGDFQRLSLKHTVRTGGGFPDYMHGHWEDWLRCQIDVDREGRPWVNAATLRRVVETMRRHEDARP